MANQLNVTVIPEREPSYSASFSIEEIRAQESSGLSGVNATIWTDNDEYLYVSETISELATLAGDSMIQATVKQTDTVTGISNICLFPSGNSEILVASGTGINSCISFKGERFYCAETKADLVAAANSGGGGSVSIPATAYATNADAVAALGVGVLYKSTTLINSSPIILITV